MERKEDLIEVIKRKLRAKLPLERRRALRDRFAEPLGLVYRRNLPRLAQIYCSDKWGQHWYCKHYQHHFASLRRKPITLLEIGIGGWDDPRSGGSSLRMWRRFFPRGRIYGVDIADKRPHDKGRIRTFRGDQSDEKFMRSVIAETGPPDIIIDDGSHLNQHVRRTFQILFPFLAENGIYAVEDTQTSYWPEYGGDSDNLTTASTSMCLLKNLVDGVNHAEFLKPNFVPSYSDQHITAMHFYHNLVFIQKGLNDEGSTMVKNNAPAAVSSVAETLVRT